MRSFSEEKSPTMGNYLTGLIVALLLTLLTFALAIAGIDDSSETLDKIPAFLHIHESIYGAMQHRFFVAGVIVLAILQFVVHLRFFLHLSFHSPQKGPLQVILFTLFIIVIMIGGTVWIMDSLQAEMQPAMPMIKHR